jgi:hypothetical protein
MSNKLVDVNLFNKILFLLVFSGSFIFAKNIYVLAFIFVILLIASIFSRAFNAIDLIIIAFILSFYRNVYLVMFIIARILLVLATIYVFTASLSKEQKRLVLEKIFYFNPRNGERLIKTLYKKNVKSYNKQKYVPFKSLLNPYWYYSKYIKKQIKIKTDYEVREVYLYSRLRFYCYYRNRTNLKKGTWGNFDNTVLLLNVLVIIIAVIWRY